jgi:hypothetical protein
MGVKDLNPKRILDTARKDEHVMLTSNWKLGASSCKLQEIATLCSIKIAHGMEQVLDALAVHVVAVIRLDRVKES